MVAIATAPNRSTHRFPSRPVLVVLPPVTRPGARTFRRRRLAVLAAAVLPVVAVIGLASISSSDAPAPTPAAHGAGAGLVYVVQPGDTVWSIARKIDPTGDTRETVDRIVHLNGSASLQPGQRLRLADN